MTVQWRKATASMDNSHCVKVGFEGDDVLLGDTKNAHLGKGEPTLRLPTTQWGEFLSALPNLSPTR